jgi:hypothetical protein
MDRSTAKAFARLSVNHPRRTLVANVVAIVALVAIVLALIIL